MCFYKRISFWLLLALLWQSAFSQTERIRYNNQNLFLSGANLAWINYDYDVGSSIPTDTTTFGNIFLQMHNAGGNAVRWWIHNDGSQTPQFGSADSMVIGPGPHTISDMKKVLDIAWQREIGVNLCLWSFDMLNTSNNSLVNARNEKLLNDTNAIRAYINTCLIPMIDSLKGHPAILCWEIFNEPEGMSTDYNGFGAQQLVPMLIIQRFVNLCAGAIHRADPHALVTNGAWSFYSNCDYALAKTAAPLSKLSTAEKNQIGSFFNRKYRTSLTPDEAVAQIEKLESGPRENFYRDDRLIAAGGDVLGTLDFYSIHFYASSTPSSTSPFLHSASSWGLNKPIVIAEFPMEQNLGVPKTLLFDTLYQLGYAGALPWSWTDNAFSTQADMLGGMQYMWNNFRQDVDVNGIAFSWPSITIVSPATGSIFSDSTNLTFRAFVSDTMPIASVTFYADTQKLGVVTIPDSIISDTSYYSFRWTNIPTGTYAITAVAVNSGGHQQVSPAVNVSFGLPPMTKFEAESAVIQGSGVTVKSDNTASDGKYLDIATQDTSVSITWTINNVEPDGNYPLAVGYKLNYESPKTQYLYINGVADTVVFTAASKTTWYQKVFNVNLVHGTNTIVMKLFWGWMYLDYIALPTSAVTSVAANSALPFTYALEQNFPNPFNPATTIKFSLAQSSHVKLIVYNLLGQKVATLADKFMNAGVYHIQFDAARFATGVYFYRLEAAGNVFQKKMLLLK